MSYAAGWNAGISGCGSAKLDFPATAASLLNDGFVILRAVSPSDLPALRRQMDEMLARLPELREAARVDATAALESQEGLPPRFDPG
jgi:hypothetical protein